VLVRMAIGSEATSPTRIYNATTGAIVAEWREASDETVDWRCGMQFGESMSSSALIDDDGGNWVIRSMPWPI
jgi:hypothetical protein